MRNSQVSISLPGNSAYSNSVGIKRKEGYYTVSVEERTDTPMFLGKTIGKHTVLKTYMIQVASNEMRNLRVGEEVSIVRGGIFSKTYYLKGNPNCSYFCNSILVTVTRK